MNRSPIRVSTYCLAMLLIALATEYGLAQISGDLGYRVHWLEQAMPPEMTNFYVNDLKVNESANLALIVGWASRVDRPGRQAVIYDHLGFIDPNQPQKVWDIQELLGPNPPSWAPASHVESSFVSVNGNGRLCGYIKSDANDRIGVYFDLNSQQHELQPLPSTSPNALEFMGLQVNELGDILVLGKLSGSWRDPEISIYDPLLFETIDVPVPVYWRETSSKLCFNSYRQIVGVIPGSTPWGGTTFGAGVFRHTVVDADNDGISDGVTEEFFDLSQPKGINDFSQFSGVLTVEVPRNRRQTDYKHYAARIGADGSVEWNTGFGTWQRAGEINNSGDMLHVTRTENQGTPTEYLFYEGDPNTIGDEDEFVEIIGLITDGEVAGGYSTEFRKLSDRDHTGFGWIYGITDTDGDGSFDQDILLIPEIAGPTPGINITHSGSLVTTEAGGQDTFDVALGSQPTDDVTIGVSSSDLTEGTVDRSILTFTPVDWNVPQTVTITGVDDADLDGDVVYTVVTVAATSTDPDYDGLDADDVQVTNLDDDGPPGGGSETYNSTDAPQSIPDNDPGGIASNIPVGDHTITNLTINVNITHQRPSDLEVYLWGPDPSDPPVQLLNVSGDNNVTDFNGESSLGLWTLEVYDTRKKRTGTLNSWSITVDY